LPIGPEYRGVASVFRQAACSRRWGHREHVAVGIDPTAAAQAAEVIEYVGLQAQLFTSPLPVNGFWSPELSRMLALKMALARALGPPHQVVAVLVTEVYPARPVAYGSSRTPGLLQ
jgi:hypothetical protein